MNPVAIVKVVAAVASAAVSVQETPEYKRVRVLGIPVYDSRWEGVKRRQARRAARREASK